MNKQMIAIYALMGLLMLQYQNCAPNGQDFDSVSVSQESDGLVDTIDEVTAGAIFFPQEKVFAADLSQEMEVIGACGEPGSIIGWTVRNQEGALVDRGRSTCDRGAFVVALSDESQGHCEGDLQLKAALGVDNSSEVTIVTACDI